MDLMKNYRRYRHENRYDAPLLIFFTDVCLGLGKLLFLAILLAGLWVAGNRLAQKVTAPPVAQSATNVKTVSQQTSQTNSSLESRLESLAATTEVDSTTSSSFAMSSVDMNSVAMSEGTAKENRVTEKWILEQKASTFTIQFGSSPDLELLEQFIPVINTGQPIALYAYKKTPTGRNVYGLATGLYNDLDTALSTVEKLPAAAKEFEPWVRPMKDLQTQINRTSSKG